MPLCRVFVCVHLIRLRSFSEAHRFVVELCMEKRTIHLSPGKIEREAVCVGLLEVSMRVGEKLERKSQGEDLLSLASVAKKSIKFTRTVSRGDILVFTYSCLTLNYILVMEIGSNFGTRELSAISEHLLEKYTPSPLRS
jgi:hypothetical protein